MSIYKELNDIQLDITEFEETPLTKIEEKQWEKRVKNKLRKNKKTKKWFGVMTDLHVNCQYYSATWTNIFSKYAIYCGID